MKRVIFILGSIILICLLFSCEKVFLGEEPDNTPRNNFKYLWQKIETGYSLFDVKEVNWESVYYKYYDLITNDIPEEQLFNHLSSMLNELKDGHINLYAPFQSSRFDITLLGNVNIDFRIIKDNYLAEDCLFTGPFTHGFLENEQIGYIRYSSFSNTVTDQHLDFIFNRYSQTKGIIFDIRQNGGGYIHNVFKLLSRFAMNQTLVYYSQMKTGYLGGSNDTTFSAPEPVYAYPSSGIKFTKPFIVLTDRGTYSAASFFSLACLALPNCTIMGDTTGGGLGLPRGGQLPNGWTYRFPVTRTLSTDGKNFENGVPPDIYNILLPDHNITGIDNILDNAIDILITE